MYLLGYIPKDDRLYLGDKELNIVSYSLLVSVLEYQTAVMRRDFGMADKVLPTIPKEQRTRVAHFLEKQVSLSVFAVKKKFLCKSSEICWQKSPGHYANIIQQNKNKVNKNLVLQLRTITSIYNFYLYIFSYNIDIWLCCSKCNNVCWARFHLAHWLKNAFCDF